MLGLVCMAVAAYSSVSGRVCLFAQWAWGLWALVRLGRAQWP